MTFPPLESLVPHRPPMLWLDAVVGRDGDAVRCQLTLRPEHVFVTADQVEALWSIEWMAQAVAALVGLRDLETHTPPRPGYLIAIPHAHFLVEQFKVGDVVEVEARRTWGDDQLAAFECRVERGGTLCSTAQVSVYRGAMGMVGGA